MQGYFKLMLSFIVFMLLACDNDKQEVIFNGMSAFNDSNMIKHYVQSDTTQQYHIYLPDGYNEANKFPVIFAFDPHARGDIPVAGLAPAADIFGYIIVGSDNFYNNVNNPGYIFQSLLSDVTRRYHVDQDRLYLAGFSGGARVAGALGLSSNRFKGIIACGAGVGMQPKQVRNKNIQVINIAGKEGVNYQEVKRADRIQNRYMNIHHLILFNEGHQWPPDSVLFSAVVCLESEAVRKGLDDNAKEKLKQYYAYYKNILNKQIEEERYVDAYNMSCEGLYMFKELFNVKYFNRQKERLEAHEAVLNHHKKVDHLEKVEQQVKQKYIKAFPQRSISWWKNEVDVLKDKIKNEQNEDTKYMYIRLNNFLSMLGYIFTDRSINQDNIPATSRYLSIYKMVDPENPDLYYLCAKSFMIKGQEELAKLCLDTAFSKGFDNMKEFKDDEIFMGVER